MEQDFTGLPPGVGPHEGIEFDLMRRGDKDIALFFEIAPDGLEEILQDGFCLLQFLQIWQEDRTYFTYIVFRPGFEAGACRLKSLVETTPPEFDRAREHEIGRLLSYTEAEVEAFLDHVCG